MNGFEFSSTIKCYNASECQVNYAASAYEIKHNQIDPFDTNYCFIQ